MTEEDQKLVTLAALHGARFTRNDGFWRAVGGTVTPCNKFTIGRSANQYLYDESLRDYKVYRDYELRTDDIHAPQDVDPKFIESVLA